MKRPIVFFDGVCVLCDRFVGRVLRADTRRSLRFAPLQGQTAKELLPRPPLDPRFWSVAYLDGKDLLRESDAVIAIGRRLGGWWWILAGFLGILPRSIRDALYRAVAARRYRWFGRRGACRFVANDERFLP